MARPMTTDPLPGVAGEIAELIGEELTLKLLAARGGTEVAIPARPEGSVLAEIVGADAAEILLGAFGRVTLTLPCAHLRGARGRRARAKAMLRRGASLSDVALACEVHIRTVSIYRRDLLEAGEALPRSGDQLRLPID